MNQLALWLVCGLFLTSATAFAAESAAPIDLVGRNGQFTIKHQDGTVESVDSGALEVKGSTAAKNSAPSTGASAVAGAKSASVTPAAKGGAPVRVSESKPAPQAPAAKKKEDTPSQQADRVADIEQLRKMRNEGGAYFYDADKKPISAEEIDKRIANGDVAGINVVGLHLEEFNTKSTTPPGASFQVPPLPAPDPPKPEKRYSSRPASQNSE